ncbi:hypothetical protein NIES267_18110 [Calothrix parasitica NIES-267]|uniref:CopG domain protein DNA-binding domain protein n=1 Tax=Calothrix parasitica NIES-267 TaxID=1973488 RepID=A0A1Z4LM77_9CYAN|nr:hypothetical protein NIES267_18110 [Calothrix parasitica NIES-267]
MKKKRLEIRLSERRLNKLRLYAASKDKTMTAVIEEIIDLLASDEIDKSLAVLKNSPIN